MRDYEQVERNLRHSMRCYTLASEDSALREESGVLIVSTGIDSAVFNFALLSEPVGPDANELDRRITTAAVYFQSRATRWSFWVCNDLLHPSLLREARGLFQRRGMYRSSENPGMLAERVEPASRTFPPLDIRRVGNPETRLSFCHIISAVFRLPFETALKIYNSDRSWTGDLVAYVGYLDNQPVATAGTVTVEGAIGVYSVATLAPYRGRGIGECMMRHALDRARELTGIERSVLQASQPGPTLYDRMGYHKVTHFTLFTTTEQP